MKAASYTPEWIKGFIIRHEELPVKGLWFIDIKADKKTGITRSVANIKNKIPCVNTYLLIDGYFLRRSNLLQQAVKE